MIIKMTMLTPKLDMGGQAIIDSPVIEKPAKLESTFISLLFLTLFRLMMNLICLT